MATIYKYYLNDKEYNPINTGGFTFDITLVQEAGSYQYVKELNGSIDFKDAAYEYILLHAEDQKILLSVKEFCGDGTFVIWDGYFTRRDCKFFPDKKMLQAQPKQDSLFKCLTDNYDRKYNFLEATNVVDTTYNPDLSNFEFLVTSLNEQPAFWGCNVSGVGTSPWTGSLFSLMTRELRTTYCQAGEPQSPTGEGWKLYTNNCTAKNLSTWYRCPPVFDVTSPFFQASSFGFTTCITAACVPAPPPVTASEDWELLATKIADDAVAGTYWRLSFWIDKNAYSATNQKHINNGRNLVDVIDLGLNKHCSTLDLQSQFLIDRVNPVTGNSPSSTEGIQFHSISDVKDPDATEPATVEEITLKEIFESYINAKLNCFWMVDEGTDRLIIEHYNDLYTSAPTTDLTAIQSGKFTELRNEYEYDNSDTPKAEAFPSMDSSIDFTGVDINFDNASAEGVKSYNTSKFYSEVESILIDQANYPTEGIVAITPDSCAPIGSTSPSGVRAEIGAITGEYLPNIPQGMANLHDKFWKVHRPFAAGELNFVEQAFNKPKVNKKTETITIPMCCFFLFQPMNKFKSNNFNSGQLQAASFNPKSGYITLNINYYE